MVNPVAVLATLLLTLLLAPTAAAQSAPEDLDPWRDWVLEKHDDLACPWQMSQQGTRVCVWPGQLDMELHSTGLDFRFEVEVFQQRATVALPGSSEHWPGRVTVDGQRAAVLDRAGVPGVALNQGKHVIEGEFRWQKQPGALRVPSAIALVSTREAGRAAPIDRRGDQVVFSRRDGGEETQRRNTLSVEVFRKLHDGVPVTLETRVQLSVSGEPREVRIGQLAWEGTEVTGFQSRLPARVEDDGDLRLQLVAGEHSVTVHSRFVGPIEVIRAQPRGEHWPATEYLSFVANSNLRQVKLSGAPSIDTSQAPIPPNWQGLPTYRLDGESALQLETEFRGDHAPAANQLSVRRELWLDFQGEALTGLEAVSGAMHRGWRLNAQPDTEIGRAKVADHAVMVTDYAGAQGVEIRSPEIRLSAVTRIHSPTRFSAVGWDARADAFEARLHTPPGWRVWHATGVDSISGTWVSRWDLWDIFLLLIVAAATRKLLGLKAATLATLALIVGYHERGMPIAYYPALLLLIPLLPIVSGRLKRAVSGLSLLTCLALGLLLVGYAVSTFRVAIYPSLERENVGRYDAPGYLRTSGGADLDDGIVTMAQEPVAAAAEFGARKITGKARRPEELTVTARERKQDAYHLGEHDRVQTGPGAPVWLWQSVHLGATGPVPGENQIRIHYSAPWLTSLWRILSVLLAVAYAVVLMAAVVRRNQPGATITADDSPPGSALAIVLIGTVLMGAPQGTRAADYPPRHLLDEMERRLVEAPDCLPHCASLDRGEFKSTKDTLNLSFEAYADADILLPLPTPREGWQVSRILVDGSDGVAARWHEGHLAIRLSQGHHQVSMAGDLLGDMASISLPLPIHNITASGEHWLLSGLVDGRVPSGTLSLRARSPSRKQQTDTLIPNPVAPFVIVHREFHMGTQWRMTTTVRRLAPRRDPLSVEIPLLEFEQALSDTINFKDGKALLQFSDQQQEIRWESALETMEQMQLTAATSDNYLETWRLLPSALWRADYEGIPPVKEAGGVGSLQPFWRPWPGEQLTVRFHRPAGVDGATYTVEEASLHYQGGSKVQKSTLVLKILASLGQDYTLRLPEDAVVLTLHHNGVTLNLPETNEVKIILQPGEQTVKIEFQQDGQPGWLNHSPQIQLPGGASNIALSYELPQDRWPLYLTGPAIGPAMLYWGVFCVIVLGALLLSLLARRLELDLPIGLVGWLLLGIGLSSVNSYGVLAVAVFFFLLAYRRRLEPNALDRLQFNGLQVIIGLWTVITVGCVITAIPLGLLSSPNMIVTGNGSWSHHYNFFQDRAAAEAFPTATVVSVSLVVYRVVMLLWSLWLANRLITWASWWWQAFSSKGTWRAKGARETP